YIAMMTSGSHDRLGQFPESRRTFFKPSGAPYAPSTGGPGDRLVQSDLARTLRLIAKEGAETIYRGEVARLIAEDMARNGGLITEEDLASHATQTFEPHRLDYRGFEVYGQLPNTGYPTIVEALQILEGFDVASMGFQSPEALHLIIESLRHAFVDRLRYLGDAGLMPVPMAGLVSGDYANLRREGIDRNRATPDAEPGDPWAFGSVATGVRPGRSSNAGDGNTTHISVIDRDRNLVSLTSTLGGIFGSGVVIKGTGITLNNAVAWFDPEPGSVASIGPGKRVMSAASPVVLLRDGQPFAALGSPGGRRVMSAIYQVIVNLADYGLTMQPAISAPRIHAEGRATEISTRFPEETIEALQSMGHQIALRGETLSTSFFARPNGVMIHPETGNLHGGVFPFTPATAIGL
ncbi:MAG TPA: gamma-glutamyltransferase, partial [Thermomicrobiales bacterium]|nr:gamma-glutamyltransferase [Thermomicrobiales bacterium]